jgi:aminoglycoside 6'-N-acetyltransferase
MELSGDRVLLRPLRVEDAHRIAELAADPEVARWWPDLTEAEVVGKAEGRGDFTGFAVLRDSKLIGLVQYYEELDPEYRHAGIDLFIGAPYQDRGLGTDTVRTKARHLVHDRLIIDPSADNKRAIRCDEKVGSAASASCASTSARRTARGKTACCSTC